MSLKDPVSGPSEILSAVRERLLEVEKRSGLPREAFAKEVLGIAYDGYHKICSGAGNPTIGMLDRIARNLGVSARVLVGAAPLPDDLGYGVAATGGKFGRPRPKKIGVVARDKSERDAGDDRDELVA